MARWFIRKNLRRLYILILVILEMRRDSGCEISVVARAFADMNLIFIGLIMITDSWDWLWRVTS